MLQFFYHGAAAPSGPGPPHYQGFTVTLRHAKLGRTSLDEWSARLRDLYLTTHNTHKRQTSSKTHNPSKRAAVDPRLRPRGHWDRQILQYRINYVSAPASVFYWTQKSHLYSVDGGRMFLRNFGIRPSAARWYNTNDYNPKAVRSQYWNKCCKM
jgi:hypothetical protein